MELKWSSLNDLDQSSPIQGFFFSGLTVTFSPIEPAQFLQSCKFKRPAGLTDPYSTPYNLKTINYLNRANPARFHVPL